MSSSSFNDFVADSGTYYYPVLMASIKEVLNLEPKKNSFSIYVSHFVVSAWVELAELVPSERCVGEASKVSFGRLKMRPKAWTPHRKR